MGNKAIEKKHTSHRQTEPASAEETSTLRDLAFTAAGAAGSALLGAMLARRGYAPKSVSGAIAALGAGFAGIADSDALRAFGAGAMSGAGAQLVLMLFLEYEDKKNVASDAQGNPTGSRNRPPAPGDAANANVVPLAAQAVAS